MAAAVQWIQFLAIAAIFLISRVSLRVELESESPPVVYRIAFGSCANQSAPQRIWDAINGFDPQLFIWLGDNVYGDNKRPFRIFGKGRTIGPWKNVPRFYPVSEEDLKNRYETEKRNPGYSALTRRSKGRNLVGKIQSQRLLLDFLDEAEDSPRRRQASVYASYLFGPPGNQIKVKPLDVKAWDNMVVPLRCACPTPEQTKNKIKHLVTYPIVKGDNITSIVKMFRVDVRSVLSANNLLAKERIYPYTTILVPISI